LENEEDKELERIKRARMQEIMKSRTTEKKEMLSDKPIEVTDATFKEIVERHPLVVVDCWASWCGPCRIVALVIEELARDYAGKVLFGKLNVDKNRVTAMQYQIRGIPTLLVFHHGKLVDRIIGALPKQILEPKIKCHL
jgi:thioredoxin 1